jgi:hypothetical protein
VGPGGLGLGLGLGHGRGHELDPPDGLRGGGLGRHRAPRGQDPDERVRQLARQQPALLQEAGELGLAWSFGLRGLGEVQVGLPDRGEDSLQFAQ